MNLTPYEIVMKLTGPVLPIGETRADEERLANMRTLTELTDLLLYEISAAASFAEREEASMKRVGIAARQFLENIQDQPYAAQGREETK